MFNFRFSELVQSLSLDEMDSVLEGQRFMKVIRYLNMRYTLIREIVNVLTNERLFTKLSNAKKYILLYFVMGLQVLEEVRISCIEGGRTADIPLFRRYIQQNGKKMKNGKSAFHWLQNSYSKVQEYLSKASNTNNRFLLQADGKKLVQYCNSLNKAITLEHKNMDEVCANLEAQTKEAREKAKEDLIKGKNRVNNTIANITNVLSEFCKKQFNSKHINGPHKLPDDKNEDIEEMYRMFTKKFDLTVQALITSSQENFIVYDSMLVRLLHAEDTEHFENFINAKPLALKDMLRKQRDCLNAASDIIVVASSKKTAEAKSKKGKTAGEK